MAKMKLIYTPEGASRREWIINLSNPGWDLTYATEKATDWPWKVFVERLENSSFIALRALLWTLRKRDEPKLQLEAVKPDMDELDFQAECPRCKDWVDDADHDCGAQGPGDEGDEEQGPGEA